MTKQEFLKGLEDALLEQMDISEAAPHIKYYREYIESEIAKGKTEEEVLGTLSNPRLIAKNIVDNKESSQRYNHSVYEYSGDNRYNEYDSENHSSGVHFLFNGKSYNGIVAKIILGAILLLMLMIILVIIGGIFFIIFRIVLPVVLIVGVITLVIKLFKNNT